MPWEKCTGPSPRAGRRCRAPARADGHEGLARGLGPASPSPWDAPGVPRDPASRGRVLYLRAGCVACHGAQGRGGHPNNNVPGGAIPALDKAAETYKAEELVEKIRRGVRPVKDDPRGAEPLVSMPAWGERLKDDELQAVAAYLLSLGAGIKREDW